MLRSLAVEQKQQGTGATERFLASTDTSGKLGTMLPAVTNAMNRNPVFRGVLEKVVGVAKQRLLPDYAMERFSKWFRRQPRRADVRKRVTLFPTCLVEYQQPAIGKDFVRICDRNDVGVESPDGLVCCGMPWLDGGDVDKFREHAERNVRLLKQAVDQGMDIIAPQPTCTYVLKKEYPDYLGTQDAKDVAQHTYDPAEYLMAMKRAGELSTEFPGQKYETITWHAPCHLRAQNIGYKSRDLMALTGAKVKIVDKCSAIDGTWGLRAENYELARKVAKPMVDAIEKADGQLVAGDCHLANGVILEETGKRPVHPIQVLARAYGIPEE
jgi:Fe-S oxidoreductase